METGASVAVNGTCLTVTGEAAGGGLALAGEQEGAQSRIRALPLGQEPIAGGAQVRLTSHSADDTDPEFSPDGQRIAWTSQADDVKGDIWVMDADGDDKERLTDWLETVPEPPALES